MALISNKNLRLGIGVFLASSVLFALTQNVLAQLEPAPQSAPVAPAQPSPNDPYISISPDVLYPLDEILYIAGIADPNALVTVTILKQGDQPVRFTVKADSRGEWVVNEKVYLSQGNWEVRARQQVGSAVSSWSNPRVIRSVVNGVDIFGFKVKYVVIAVIALLFLITITLIYVYFRRKISQLKRGLMEKQLRETEEKFHRGFAEIRKDLMDQLKDLAVNSQGRQLTPDEIEKRDHVLRELEEMEKNLEHDVGDIGRKY